MPLGAPSRVESLPGSVAPVLWVIHLDCVVSEQKPAPTIVAISKGFLAAFHAQTGGNREPGGDEQSNWISIEWSRGHRAQMSNYHGRSAETSGWSRSTPLANHFICCRHRLSRANRFGPCGQFNAARFSSRRVPTVPWKGSRAGAQRPWLSRCVRCLFRGRRFRLSGNNSKAPKRGKTGRAGRAVEHELYVDVLAGEAPHPTSRVTRRLCQFARFPAPLWFVAALVPLVMSQIVDSNNMIPQHGYFGITLGASGHWRSWALFHPDCNGGSDGSGEPLIRHSRQQYTRGAALNRTAGCTSSTWSLASRLLTVVGIPFLRFIANLNWVSIRAAKATAV